MAKVDVPYNKDQVKEYLKEREGYRNDVYPDIGKRPTIGRGHLLTDSPRDKKIIARGYATPEEVDQLFEEDVAKHQVFKKDLKVPLSIAQEAALTSLAFNLGPKSLGVKKAVQFMNEGNPQAAHDIIQKYNKVRNPDTKELEVSPAISARRAEEGKMLLKGREDRPGITKPSYPPKSLLDTVQQDTAAEQPSEKVPEMPKSTLLDAVREEHAPKKKSESIGESFSRVWEGTDIKGAVKPVKDYFMQMGNKAKESYADITGGSPEPVKPEGSWEAPDTKLMDRVAQLEEETAQSAAAADQAAARAPVKQTRTASPEAAPAPAANFAEQFKSDMADLRATYKASMAEIRAKTDAAESNTDRREMLQTLTHALGQLGAAYYGLKKGVDMSGIKFAQKDFDKERERIMDKFKTDATIASQNLREGATGLAEANAVRQKDESLDIQKSSLQASTTKAIASADEKLRTANEKAMSKAKEDADKIMRSIRDIYAKPKMDDDEKAAQVRLILVQSGVSEESAQTITTEPTWFGLSSGPKSSADALDAISNVIAASRLDATTTEPAGATSAAVDIPALAADLVAANPGKLTQQEAEEIVRGRMNAK